MNSPQTVNELLSSLSNEDLAICLSEIEEFNKAGYLKEGQVRFYMSKIKEMPESANVTSSMDAFNATILFYKEAASRWMTIRPVIDYER